MPFDSHREQQDEERRSAGGSGLPRPRPPRSRGLRVDPAYLLWGVLIGLTIVGLVAWAL